jgi:hypothetical protein
MNPTQEQARPAALRIGQLAGNFSTLIACFRDFFRSLFAVSLSSRLLIRLVAAGMVLIAAHYLQAQSIQSMMLRNNQSPASGQAINRGDFNNDGILDLVTVNASSEASVSVYLGRADGTFNAALTTNTGAGGVDLANDLTASEVNKLFSLSPGSHFIVAKAFDANGNEISDARTISVQ